MTHPAFSAAWLALSPLLSIFSLQPLHPSIYPISSVPSPPSSAIMVSFDFPKTAQMSRHAHLPLFHQVSSFVVSYPISQHRQPLYHPIILQDHIPPSLAR